MKLRDFNPEAGKHIPRLEQRCNDLRESIETKKSVGREATHEESEYHALEWVLYLVNGIDITLT